MTRFSRSDRRVARLTGCGLAWLLAAGMAGAAVSFQAQAPAPLELPSVSGTTSRTKAAPVRVAQAPRADTKPAWNELTPAQQKALRPLTASWNQLSEAHKRKWIALSQNYPTMPPAEQLRLHSRMAEWAALSPQQRTQARLNFAESNTLPASDKKAKWEAYQALPAEEKRKLAGAAAAKPAPPSTAAAVQPVPQQKLAKVPKPRKDDAHTPRLAGGPSQVDHHTLLPHPGAAPSTP